MGSQLKPSNSSPKPSPFAEKKEIQKTLALMRVNAKELFDLEVEINGLKQKIDQAQKDLKKLYKSINILLKDSNFTSANPSKILMATSKHKLLIEQINQNIENLENFNKRLNELKLLVARATNYIHNKDGETTRQERDLKELSDLETRTKSNLDISEIEVINTLGNVYQLTRQIEKLTKLPQKFDDLNSQIEAFQNKLNLQASVLILNYRNHGRTDFDLNIRETSERSLFERLPEPGELVVLESHLSGTLVRVDNQRQNIKDKKYALIDRRLVLDGIRHGDIYSDGATTYGVVGFINGRVMLQLLTTTSYLPTKWIREFKSVDTKSLHNKYKKLGYTSYNRPVVAGDIVFNDKSGTVTTIDTMARMDKTISRDQLALLHWNSKDTDGIEHGMVFQPKSQIEFWTDGKHVTSTTLTVLGIFPNGTFLTSEVMAKYRHRAYGYSKYDDGYLDAYKHSLKTTDYETLIQYQVADTSSFIHKPGTFIQIKYYDSYFHRYMIASHLPDGRSVGIKISSYEYSYKGIENTDARDKDSAKIIEHTKLKPDDYKILHTPE